MALESVRSLCETMQEELRMKYHLGTWFIFGDAHYHLVDRRAHQRIPFGQVFGLSISYSSSSSSKRNSFPLPILTEEGEN